MDAHADLPPNIVSESLGPEVISGSFTYGALGACQGGTLMLAQVPNAWIGAPYPRLLRTRLESEHGSGYVHVGVLDTLTLKAGELRQVGLLAPHRVFADLPGATYGSSPLTAGVRTFGPTALGILPEQTRNEAAQAVLMNWPNSEYGVGPDLYAVIGKPENAVPATYTADDRALSLTNLGYVATEYVTDALFDPGENWQKRWYSRTDIPPYVPRRSAPVKVNRPTLERTQAFRWSGSGWSGSVTADNPVPFVAGPYSQGYTQNEAVMRNVKLVVDCAYTINDITPLVRDEPYSGGQMEITLRQGGAVIGTYSQPLYPGIVGLAQTARFEVNLAEWGSVSTAFSVEYAISPGTNSRTAFRLSAPLGTHTYEVPNYLAVTMPDGYAAPYLVGPSFQFKLPGWHVPPFRVTLPEALCGVPGGLVQYAAQAVVTWNRNEASTLITTAARPYRGQRRRG